MQSLKENSTSPVRTNQVLWEAWAEYIRMFEPYSWFGTFTFKKDILTYAQENPAVRTARYQWHEKTGKYENGTYVRGFTSERWRDSGTYERTGMYVQRVQEEHSIRMYRRWARKLNEKVFGSRYRDKGKGLLHVYAIEYQKRGVAHLHSLVKGVPPSFSRIEYEKLWQHLHPNNGFANIFPYDPVKGAAGYLAKYVLKGGNVDIVAPACFQAALSAQIDYVQGRCEKGDPTLSPPGL